VRPVPDDADSQAQGEAPGLLSPGEGPYVWFLLRGVPPLPEVIGIYDDPPPAECSVINSARVSSIGAVPLLKKLTSVRDSLLERAGHLLG